MTSAQDPFYVVREEIQDSIDKLQHSFHRWEQTASNTGEYVHLTKELLTSCESIEWQVDELEKTILVASRDPAYYGLDEVELSRRRNWTVSACNQVGSVRRAVEKGKSNSASSGRTNLYSAQDNDDFISSESDRQQLLMRQQDDELDELSESVQRIGNVGLTIHDELSSQVTAIDEVQVAIVVLEVRRLNRLACAALNNQQLTNIGDQQNVGRILHICITPSVFKILSPISCYNRTPYILK